MKRELEKYSIGVGDRFGMEGIAQLRALQRAEEEAQIVPVWNKSHREHTIIGTGPGDTRRAADEAVRESGWKRSYYLDADHIGLGSVDRFLAPCDFFTIDVADFIGKPAPREAMDAFLAAMAPLKGALKIPRVGAPVAVTDRLLSSVAEKYLGAVLEAGRVYRHIAERKGEGTFVTEISVDEAGSPQTPAELVFILAAVAREQIPVQTVAPKFSGAFLKGVDYVGNVQRFAREFEEDLAVLSFAVKQFGLPKNLKLSVHSGSDKFSIYPAMHRAMKMFDAGLHLKTAGTTWLEEVVGLAASGGEGLTLAKEIYARGFSRYEELAKPYSTVIEIDRAKLPSPADVERWGAEEYAETLRHDQSSPRFNPHFRQLVHIAFRVAAEMGDRFKDELRRCRAAIEANVTENILERHVRPVFLGVSAGNGKNGKHSPRDSSHHPTAPHNS